MDDDKDNDEATDQFNSSLVYKSDNVNHEPTFGILFDIDGVLARGATPLQCAIDMFNEVKTADGEPTVPMAFLTNACHLSDTKAFMIQKWFNIKIYPDQVIHAPSPLKVFTHWHNKCVLFVGQDDIQQIAYELGFKKVITLDQVKEAYPLLDMVDHSNRRNVASGYKEIKLDPVEAIILMGEPKNWESYLQLIIDLLVTNGKPDISPESFPEKHLPILACNMDLVFMAEAVLPRFGHGAFLLCLETLYQKITGHPLNYTAIIGKPSEITFRFAEHTISLVAKRMGIKSPIKSLYFFGDNPAVDILGANLYNNYLKRFRRMSGGKEITKEERQKLRVQASMSASRVVPEEAEFLPQTAKQIDSILVHTGVYKPDKEHKQKQNQPNYCHRDFTRASELDNPMIDVEDCYEGMQAIFRTENFTPKK